MALRGAVGAPGGGDLAIIEARGIVKDYDTGKITVKALRGLDLVVEKGEMVAIMGPSGCGKTTLLNCLAGIDDITEGKIIIEGKELSAMSDNARTDHRAQRMGFIFQAYNLLPVLTAVENVELPLLVSGHGRKAAREKALEALKMVGLEERAAHKPTELSGGEQQRVTIARSLVNSPAIVWADEPTGNLDTEITLQIMDILKTLNRKLNQTYVVVTHDARVGGLADRIVHMENGRIVSEEVPKDGSIGPRDGTVRAAAPAATGA
jgi:putative ABC transport system ATP-binding protein